MKRYANGAGRRGFTLTELLIVIFIVLLISVMVLPAVNSSLQESQAASAARTLQAAISGARDAAIRAQAPRGIRLLHDPLLTEPSMANATTTAPAGSNILAFSRIQPIEPAPDYMEGLVNIGPMLQATTATFPTTYPNANGGVYPFPDPNTLKQQVLMIEESPYAGGYILRGGVTIPNPPTSWYWNIRIGDKIQINNAGPWYTVVGPCTVNPITSPGNNTELFVNIGPPGTAIPLLRAYYDTSVAYVDDGRPEFLFLVNGVDDNKDGYVDSGFDGFNNNYTADLVSDEVLPNVAPNMNSEWEDEKWLGAFSGVSLVDATMTGRSPSDVWINANVAKTAQDLPYKIKRRPVPSPGSREQVIPGPIVIDATTWNSTEERSRLPVDPYSLQVDILINPDGQIVPQTIYSSPTAFNNPFYHFWLTERTDVQPPIVNEDVPYRLPMPVEAVDYPDPQDTSGRVLKGNRMLISIFTKSGLVTSGPIENFNGANIIVPYLDAQRGITGAKQAQ